MVNSCKSSPESSELVFLQRPIAASIVVVIQFYQLILVNVGKHRKHVLERDALVFGLHCWKPLDSLLEEFKFRLSEIRFIRSFSQSEELLERVLVYRQVVQYR